MNTPNTISLSALWGAYAELIGDPSDAIELRRQPQSGIPCEMDVLFFQPKEGGGNSFAYLATAGMSVFPIDGSDQYIELTLRVDGRFELELLHALGHALAELAVLPFRENTIWGADTVIENIHIPIFERMSCAVLTNWLIDSDTFLPGISPKVRVLCLCPLFAAEAKVANLSGSSTLYKHLRMQGINWYDPTRQEGDVQGLPREPRKLKPAQPSNDDISLANLTSIWRDIESWYQANAPELIGDLAAAAREEDVLALETELGNLPTDLRASLLQHNGNININDYRYLSVMEILTLWRSMNELAEYNAFAENRVVYRQHDIFMDTWWYHKWIPIAADSAGNLYCVDTAPGLNGRVGQILLWDVVEGPSATTYSSFVEWLAKHRDELLSGKFKVIENSLLIAENRNF